VLNNIDSISVKELEESFSKSIYKTTINLIINEKRELQLKEAQDYINKVLQKESFTKYFSFRYSDRISVFLCFIIVFMFAFIFDRDKKYNVNDMIFSKPIKSVEYISGKYLGALIPVITLTMLVTVMISFITYFKFKNETYKISILDIINANLLYVFPSVIFASLFIMLLSIILKNGIAVIPIYIFYFIIMVKQDLNLNIFMRFIIRTDGGFYDQIDIENFNLIIQNRILYLLLAIILFILSVVSWKKTKSLKGEIKNNLFKRIFRFGKI
ncbi:MAG: ABC-2 transporter permease, partial [Clostridiales bacterium]